MPANTNAGYLVRYWWRSRKPVVARATKDRLMVASVMLGIAALTANRLGKKVGEWGNK